MFDKLHIFLGATVADAAARPLHWVYDKKKLNSYIKGKKNIAFFSYDKRTANPQNSAFLKDGVFFNDFVYTQSGKIKRNETLTLKPSFMLDL